MNNYFSFDLWGPVSQNYTHIGLFGAVAYMGTSYLTSVNPKRAASFVVIALVIQKLTFDYFAEQFENYRHIPFVPFCGQLFHLSFSIIVAKGIGHVIGCSLTFSQIGQTMAATTISLIVIQVVDELLIFSFHD